MTSWERSVRPRASDSVLESKGTAFSIDPKEQMIVIFMSQIHPNGDLKLDRQVKVLAIRQLRIDRDRG